MTGKPSARPALLAILLVVLLAGCASTPDYSQRQSTHSHPGLTVASTMLGKPYRYGGASPRGFDCSGLVYYSYRKAGIKVPRTTRDQLRRSSRVATRDLQPGDLLFFKIDNRSVSHVGIYTGTDRFIHAPSSGKQVSYGSLNNRYWRKRLVAAGRY